MTDLTSSESVPPWYKDFMDVFRYGFPIPAKRHTVTPFPIRKSSKPTEPGAAAQRSAAKSKFAGLTLSNQQSGLDKGCDKTQQDGFAFS